VTTAERLCSAFPLTTAEYEQLEDELGDLLHFIAWKFLRCNQQANHTEEEADVCQELRIALMIGAAYFKRQTWVEACFDVLPESPDVKRLKQGWDNRKKKHFGEKHEEELADLVGRLVPASERPSKRASLAVDGAFKGYAKSIVYNRLKQLGKRLVREKPLRVGCLSLSYDGDMAEGLKFPVNRNRNKRKGVDKAQTG
jgi:hypothetical protein